MAAFGCCPNLSVAAAAASNKKKTPSKKTTSTYRDAESESDDSPFASEEEEDSELEDFFEVESTLPTEDDDQLVDLADKVGTVHIASSKPVFASFKMDFQFPFMVYQFAEDGRKTCTVEFLVFPMPQDSFRPKCKGDVLELDVVVPVLFTQSERLMIANSHKRHFTQDTHRATAFEEVSATLHKQHDIDLDDPMKKNEIVGQPMKVKLPFACEEEISSWELKLIPQDVEFSKSVASEQYHWVLSVDLKGKEEKKKAVKKGGFRKLSSPNKQGTKRAGQGDDEMDTGHQNDNNWLELEEEELVQLENDDWWKNVFNEHSKF